ncbi:transmembrane protein 106B-like [Xenia sp. Carnegie-2017]|uniref:transmembrane protein 106B-like n=1 Tax=Xenia sp. Carnegie-2017 TaxID=2897299 RepID=UPI001F0387FA|nr:transmembrane protein 106B-like [Xenia sp. Carnegie-2017]
MIRSISGNVKNNTSTGSRYTNYEKLRHNSMASPCQNNGEPNIITDDQLIYTNLGRNHQAFTDDEDNEKQIVLCPTCRGTGTIAADDSSLLALIPVKDKRLKPKRTKLKVAIAIILTLLICGVVLFFLFPRTPSLKLLYVHDYNASFSNYSGYIFIKNRYVVKNSNFVSVRLTSLSITVTFLKVEVSDSQLPYKFEKKSVDLRSETHFDVIVKTSYNKKSGGKFLQEYCKFYPSYLMIPLRVSTQLLASFLFHSVTLSVIQEKYTSCYYNSTSSSR